jgi:hypothetical protein
VSRTDQHAPLLVRIARGDLDAYAEHEHRDGSCDLVARDQAFTHWGEDVRCRWQFHFTGTFTCSCWMCHAGRQHRAANSAERHRDHHDLAVALGRWNGGDAEAFDELRVPRSSHSW